MSRKQFLVVPARFRKNYLWVFFAVVILAGVSNGQTVPGTLKSTTTVTHISGNGCPPGTVTTYAWKFTDTSGGGHTFSGSTYVDANYIQILNYCHFVDNVGSLDEWSSDGLYYLQATGSAGSVTAVSGHMNPKFIVIGVTYAPPGPSSSVTYENSTSRGTTINTGNSFSQGYSESISITGSTGNCSGSGSGIFGFSGGVCVTGTQSTDYTMQSMNSSSISMVNKTSITDQTTGTPNSFSPVNHDYDLVWLWLNPITTFTFSPRSPKSIQWTGFGYDMADQPAIDKWPVLLGYLNGHFGCFAIDSSCDPEDAQELARSWVTKYNPQTWPVGDGPGLTMADLASIAKADPWGTNPSYAVILGSYSPPTTTDGRFTIAPVNGGNSQSFDYKQAGPGNGSGLTEKYTNENTNTTTDGAGKTYTFQEAFGLEEKIGGSFFWQSVQYDFKQTSTFNWVHSFLLTSNSITDSTDSLSITGPPCPASPGPCNPAYSGFPEFDVYQDNIFGSFMFWGVN